MAKKKAAMTERERDEAELDKMAEKKKLDELQDLTAEAAQDEAELGTKGPDTGETLGEDDPHYGEGANNPAAREYGEHAAERAGPPTPSPRDPGIVNRDDLTEADIEMAFAASFSGVVTEAFNNANTHTFARSNPTFNEQRLSWQAQLPEIKAQFERAYRRGRC